ncbi:AAA family ATPase [Bacillus sp. T17B1]|uniref:AAA family ATPase n=1 Tax=Bacillus sp. T17B1 TaxID=2918911 RepID=UPI00227F26AB|nr:AAA family ATPase [Bacillus sp. T17B1]
MKLGFYITKLELVGEDKRSSITLDKGLNVIYGPTGTGKSYIFQCINYMLGGKNQPDEIIEIKGYYLIRMQIKTYSGEVFTLQRELVGGSFKKYDCEIDKIEEGSKFTTLGSTDAAKNSVSKFLLSLCGFPNVEYKIKKNAKNNVERFSYRGLNHLVMVDEVRIISKESPIFSDKVQAKTKEKSIFKFIISNKDDSTLEQGQKSEQDNTYSKAKLELLEKLISDSEEELQVLETLGIDSQELLEEINSLTSVKNNITKKIENLTIQRNSYWNELQSYRAKLISIQELIARFSLLESQYNSDLERLIFLSEGKHYFNQLQMERCPLCHQDLNLINGEGEEHQEHLTESNIKFEAVNIEISKIKKHKKDLRDTLYNIKDELYNVEQKKAKISKQYDQINKKIEEELQPNLNKISNKLGEILTKQSKIDQLNFLKQNLIKLEKQKVEIESSSKGKKISPEKAQETSLDIYTKELCKEIEEILKEWMFPDTKVQFDLGSYDIIISEKKRSVYGKGYRAIAFSAFIIGLMKYCFKNSLPHTGMIILDSPLTTYKELDVPEDDGKIPEEIQNNFYEYLSKIDNQIIVLENKKPQQKLISNINFIEFTRNDNKGRYGFIE